MTQTPFTDGLPAKIFRLTNARGSTISLMDIGATWLSCQIQMPNELREVLLGVNTMHKHLEQQAYLGATVGRYANRIKQGKFVIDGESFQTSTNQTGNTLHGGLDGFDKRRWQLVEQGEDRVTFSLTSADNDQGFPGNLVAYVTYQLNDNNEVSIEYRATVDKICPVNLTNHAYFNLLGDGAQEGCLTHDLQINATQYLPTNAKGIPEEEPQSVLNSSFDFQKKKTVGKDFLGEEQQLNKAGYDHSFLLDEAYQDANKVALTLTAPDKSLQLEVCTSKPALHIYTGNFLKGTPSRGDECYENHAGIALETQYPPDSPNNEQWPQPSVYLQPGKPYHSLTRFCFSIL